MRDQGGAGEANPPEAGERGGPLVVVRLARLLLVPLLVLCLIPVGVTELHLVTLHDLVGSAIPDIIYLSHAARGVALGRVPYSPGFMTAPETHLQFVYPPLTLVLALPALLAGGQYPLGFSIEMVVLILLGLVGLHWACRRAGISYPVALVVLVVLLSMGPLLVTRVDALQGLILAGAALALRQERRLLAVALGALSVLIKETTVIAMVPIVLWVIWPDPGTHFGAGLRSRLATLGVGLFPALAVVAGFVAWSRGGVVSSALHGLSRGVQIESVTASVAMVLRPLSRVTPYDGKLASSQVRGHDLGLIAVILVVVGVVAILAGSAYFASRHQLPATAIALATAAGLLATPVLSPQYLLALFPVAVLAATIELERRRGLAVIAALLLAGLLTQTEFPYLYGSVVAAAPLGTALVAARNALLIAITVGLLPLGALAAAGLRDAGSGRAGGQLPPPVPGGGAAA